MVSRGMAWVGGGGWGARIVKELGMDMCTLLYWKAVLFGKGLLCIISILFWCVPTVQSKVDIGSIQSITF